MLVGKRIATRFPRTIRGCLVKYEPRPIDTSSVVLPDAIGSLAEKLAESAHDVWAVQRMSDGLDARAQAGLTAQEKAPLSLFLGAKLPRILGMVYDRNAAIQTLKAIMALGFRIEQEHEKL